MLRNRFAMCCSPSIRPVGFLSYHCTNREAITPRLKYSRCGSQGKFDVHGSWYSHGRKMFMYLRGHPVQFSTGRIVSSSGPTSMHVDSSAALRRQAFSRSTA